MSDIKQLTPEDLTQVAGGKGEYGKVGLMHTVKSGDMLSSIALNYYGNANLWPKIYEVNRAVIGDNPDYLQVGWKIWIP